MLGAALALSGCALPAPPSHDTAHSSQNALDWAGSYEGVTPCADCPGIRVRLTLHADGRYERTTEYLERSPAPVTVRGQFSWQPGGNALTLDAAGDGQHYAVGEGRLTLLYRDGARPTGALAARQVLTRLPGR